MNNDLVEKERQAIAWLKSFEPDDEPYYLCYSGGKDSDVIRILADLAGVKHELHHNLTSVDAPETIRYVKSIPDMHIDIPHDKNGNRVSMWTLIVKKGLPPTRLIRYCCSELKEIGGNGRMKITGVRAAESVNRAKNAGYIKIIGKPVTVQRKAEQLQADIEVTPKKGIVMNMDNDESRRLVEYCYRTTKTMLNPIVNWTDADVWDYLKYYGCDANPLYRQHCKRIGCIGCPMGGNKKQREDFELYPKYKVLYIQTFERMLKAHEYPTDYKFNWRTGQDVYDWWIGSNDKERG